MKTKKILTAILAAAILAMPLKSNADATPKEMINDLTSIVKKYGGSIESIDKKTEYLEKFQMADKVYGISLYQGKDLPDGALEIDIMGGSSRLVIQDADLDGIPEYCKHIVHDGNPSTVFVDSKKTPDGWERSYNGVNAEEVNSQYLITIDMLRKFLELKYIKKDSKGKIPLLQNGEKK